MCFMLFWSGSSPHRELADTCGAALRFALLLQLGMAQQRGHLTFRFRVYI